MSPFIHIKSDYLKTKFIASLFQREVGGNVNIIAEYPRKKIERSKLTALFLKCG